MENTITIDYTYSDGKIALATSDNGRLQYNALTPDIIDDVHNGRSLWRGESLGINVLDRFSIKDTPLWDDVLAFRATIRTYNNAVDQANQDRPQTEIDRQIDTGIDERHRHPGYCDKCQSYCYGDCSA